MTPAVTSLDHLVLTVRDLDATVRFYENVLGMGVETFHPSDGTTRTALIFGAQKINLHVAGEEFEPKAALAAPGSADLCFLSDVPLSQWQAHFANEGVAVLEGPVARTGAQGAIMSLYVRDPDDNLIEVSNRA